MCSTFQNLCLFVFLLAALRQVASLCPRDCDCRDEPTNCPMGVSLVTDGCNCCHVCARQSGDECNDHDKICDVHKNLFCDFSAAKSGDWGVCKARSGRSCRHGDVFVASGSMFEPSCKKRCWCIDGAVGCIPACPHETKIPRPDQCPNPRLQSVPGQCCDQWVCDSSSGDVVTLPLEDFWNEYVDDKTEDPNIQTVSSSRSQITNEIRDGTIYEDDIGENTDELRDFQSFQTSNVDDENIQDTENSWHENNMVPGDIDAQRQEKRNLRESLKRCKLQSSAWSPCSKTCGLGVSNRVTNNNHRCQLVREQRLCEIRRCNDIRYTPKKGRHCLRQKRSRKRVTLKYAGCASLRKVKPRHCGSCHDDKKCCTPKTTRTSRMRFRCEDGSIFTKNILVVKSCHCHKNCASLTTPRWQVVTYSLFGDMYRLQDR